MQNDEKVTKKNRAKKSKNIAVNLNKRILKLSLLMMLALITLFLFASTAEKKDGRFYFIQEPNFVLPSDEKVAKKQSVCLYFKTTTGETLSSEIRQIEVAADERVEEAVVRELAKGPSENKNELQRVVETKTIVTNIQENGDTLYLTLSYDFLNVDNAISQGVVVDGENELMRLRLATYSIVNTITGLGEYSKVLVLNDNGENQAGVRYERERYGFIADSPKLLLEPMPFESSVVLSPKTLVETALNSVINRDFETLMEHFSKQSRSVSKDEIATIINNSKYKIQSYEIVEIVGTGDEKNAVVLLNIEYKAKDGVVHKRQSVPCKTTKQGEIWKIELETIKRLVELP